MAGSAALPEASTPEALPKALPKALPEASPAAASVPIKQKGHMSPINNTRRINSARVYPSPLARGGGVSCLRRWLQSAGEDGERGGGRRGGEPGAGQRLTTRCRHRVARPNPRSRNRPRVTLGPCALAPPCSRVPALSPPCFRPPRSQPPRSRRRARSP